MSSIEQQFWQDLRFDPDYEIMSEHPHKIRRKKNQYEISEFIDNGYVNVCLKGKKYKKHRLIALQWIENDDPEHKTEVDHLNKNRTDNNISNLRWCTHRENNLNKTGRGSIKYEYVDNIPDESIVVDFYETNNGVRLFEQDRYYYYYDAESAEDIFYIKVASDLYRLLHINLFKNGGRMIRCIDINNEYVSMYVNRFKRQHDL